MFGKAETKIWLGAREVQGTDREKSVSRMAERLGFSQAEIDELERLYPARKDDQK